MSKKIWVMGIALIMLCVAVTAVFAVIDTPVFSGKGTTTLRITNPNPVGTSNATLNGSVCVTFENGTESASIDLTYEVKAGETKTYSIPGKILYMSDTYCYLK